MDYKSKLQTNNTALEGNNIDLQTILNTINSLPEATESINLDSEITTQDALIAELSTILDSKAAGGSVKTTKTIYLDWSGDIEATCMINYVSNNNLIYLGSGNPRPDVIEAEGGAIYMNCGNGQSYYSNNFIVLHDENNGCFLMATQDGETITLVSSDEQGA